MLFILLTLKNHLITLEKKKKSKRQIFLEKKSPSSTNICVISK